MTHGFSNPVFGARWWFVAAALVVAVNGRAIAQPVVPGTGEPLVEVGDDFEDPDWSYIANLPKASVDVDGQSRRPGGHSTNGRWYESTGRGQPDLIRRVATPEGGLPLSEGSLLLRSLYTGVPGRGTGQRAQDVLHLNIQSRLRRSVPVSWSPNCVVRVFLPPFEEWENASGSSFAIRADVQGSRPGGGSGGLFSFTRDDSSQAESYWPGMFIRFNSQTDRQDDKDSAHLVVRAAESGADYRGPEIKQTGWWTLGMSFTPDGRVHYYAKPGVEDLTPKDHIASHYSYGFRCQQFHTFYFDVFNQNDGRNWSTAWVIDDPTLYVIRR